jgi:hypothetical protein
MASLCLNVMRPNPPGAVESDFLVEPGKNLTDTLAAAARSGRRSAELLVPLSSELNTEK